MRATGKRFHEKYFSLFFRKALSAILKALSAKISSSHMLPFVGESSIIARHCCDVHDDK
jgi:hypothetical protein